MKKTPLAIAIQKIQDNEMLNLSDVKMILIDLLPVERECIEGAYKEGVEDVEIKNNKLHYFISAQDYFTSTYNNPQGGGGE